MPENVNALAAPEPRYGQSANAFDWEQMPEHTGRIEDRRNDPPPSWADIWEDIKRNNFIARRWRMGQYAGPRYEYLPREPMDYNDPMTIALGGHQIPVTSYGTTHFLKRYNPDLNSDIPYYRAAQTTPSHIDSLAIALQKVLGR